MLYHRQNVIYTTSHKGIDRFIDQFPDYRRIMEEDKRATATGIKLPAYID